ncbi:hypothetical protein DERP_001922 [Dermatophagoides pteronyssinus]|uniref:Uncharacterized protein n=1 Tax=Dermatophagoides pteronyssinus TaxID=6956 RepID=A0ABQ8JCE5_DERPT|nr:hypothetical protein DERP_001922 [Dermatophagoides pteronyssinus]
MYRMKEYRRKTNTVLFLLYLNDFWPLKELKEFFHIKSDLESKIQESCLPREKLASHHKLKLK